MNRIYKMKTPGRDVPGALSPSVFLSGENILFTARITKKIPHTQQQFQEYMYPQIAPILTDYIPADRIPGLFIN